MAVTLSHLSALDALRTLRSQGVNVKNAESVALAAPSLWLGKRWRMRAFEIPEWKWGKPSANEPLHILTPKNAPRINMANVISHMWYVGTPIRSALYLDDYALMVCPELLFLQMASTFSLSALVMLGYELCGHFSRDAANPLNGFVSTEIPSATSVEEIIAYLSSFSHVRGISRAKTAISYVADHAVSAPEAVLATMYSLPPKESGYGMGPITLNKRIELDALGGHSDRATRYPDILFPFAPIGINYDGEEHLDLDGFLQTARAAVFAEEGKRLELLSKLEEKTEAIREKYVDDLTRNQQLLAQGKVVIPVAKEHMCGRYNLDDLTARILACARTIFGVDTHEYEMLIEDTNRKRDRYDMLQSLLPYGIKSQASHGRI